MGAQSPVQEREPPVAAASSTSSSEVPGVPGMAAWLRGFNGGLTLSGLHDSQTGWSTFLQPAAEYSFSDRFTLDLTMPVYLYRLTSNPATNPRPDDLLVPRRGEPGDLVLSVHAQFSPPEVQYEATVSATAPTGDSVNGLSTGRPTFDLSNLFQHEFRLATPSIEMGVGDSTTLANRLVVKNFTSLGPLAHFQAGIAVPLPGGISFESDAFEQLPIGDQKIYQSVKRKGTTTLVVTGHNVSEDNGFTNSLDVPLDRHTTLSAYYSRSLRLHDDTVSIGLTYVLRGAKSDVAKSDASKFSVAKSDKEPPDGPSLKSMQQPVSPPAASPQLSATQPAH